MRNKIIKTSVLLISISFVLSACSVSFPWEKDRSVVDVVGTEANQGEHQDLDEDEPAKGSPISLQGELRKFSDLNSLNNFIISSDLVGSDLKNLSAEDSYGFFSDINLKDLSESSVNLTKPDIVKIKGDYAYVLSKDKLSVVRVKEDFTNSPVFELKIDGVALELDVFDNYLAIAGYKDSPKEGKHYSFLKIFNISEPNKLIELRSLLFEGHYSGFNLDNGFAYFLSVSPVELSLAKKVVLPQVLSQDEILSDRCSLNKECLLSQAYYFNNLYNNLGFLSSTAISLSDNKKPLVRQLFLLDDAYRFYSSLNNNIYLAKHNSLSQSDLERDIKKDLVIDKIDEVDRLALQKIENIPSYLHTSKVKDDLNNIISKYFTNLSEEEVSAHEETLEENLKTRVKSLSSRLDITSVYKFAWKGQRLAYLAKGLVPGVPLKSDSFDEDGDSLRMATVRGDLWPLLFIGAKKSYSNLYVLDENLKTINSLENISTDSMINKASFMADRVYLKTAKEDKPVYVISLDRQEPLAVLGAISTETYANFYPFNAGGDNLLALGKPLGDGAGAKANLKLTVFDFEDIKKPAALSTYAIGDEESDSFALLDYKAISNALTKKIISLPASFKDQGKLSFSGALVFDYNSLGELNLLHRIDHSGGGIFQENISRRDFNYLNSTVQRSFVSGNNIYTISSKYLKINDLTTGNELASVNLLPDSYDDLLVTESEPPKEDFEPGEMGNSSFISMAEAGIIIENQANKFYGDDDKVLTVSALSEEYGMYQADINTAGTIIKVFLSKDASLFFTGIVPVSNLENYENTQEKHKSLSLPEAQDMAVRYINYLTKDDDKKRSVKEVTEEDNLYYIIAGPEDGSASAYYMSKDGYLFFSEVALVK